MKIMKVVLILIFSFLCISQVALAEQESLSVLEQGEKLVRQAWSDMKSGNIEAIEKYTAQGFQSVHQDGSRTREQEIKLIKGLNMGEYTLNNFMVTQNGPVIVASYFVSVEETIKGQQLSSESMPRLSIFLNTASGWQWIAHGNFKSLKVAR
jgi:predicted  nucleic acid-binding Zn-ribbon protein